MSLLTWIILGAIVVIVLWGMATYNRLVAIQQQCNRAFADIDVQLKQRHDLVPNLVETVKGYASHERSTLDAVVQARSAAVSAQEPAARAQAETLLGELLQRLFALAEAYPNLKANSNFQQLQTDLTGIESRLAAARRSFNEMVRAYNSMIQQFPTALVATALGFRPHEFFGAKEERQILDQAPQVKF
jgi:LemA protein